MQAEVDFGERLLFLDGANSIVKVFGLVDILWRVFHAGWRGAEVWRIIVGVEVVEEKATRGEDEGRAGPCAAVAAGETKAEASMRCDGYDKTIFSSSSNLSNR
jgi:predicted cobalt transporter CbtA